MAHKKYTIIDNYQPIDNYRLKKSAPEGYGTY